MAHGSGPGAKNRRGAFNTLRNNSATNNQQFNNQPSSHWQFNNLPSAITHSPVGKIRGLPSAILWQAKKK
jgi:hypothetical protein